MERYDLIVIGSGPAGRRAAIQAAKLGKSVLVVEKRLRVGGVSVHTGTIPSKTLRETVLNLSGWRERGFYGLAYRVKKDIEGKDLGVRLRMTLDHEIEVLRAPVRAQRREDLRRGRRASSIRTGWRSRPDREEHELRRRQDRHRGRHRAVPARRTSPSTTATSSTATRSPPNRMCRGA